MEESEHRADRLARAVYDARADEPTPEHLVRLVDALEQQSLTDEAA